MYLKKVLAFLAFCIVAAAFLACSEDFIVSISAKEDVKISDDLQRVDELSISVRYRDSVFINAIGEWSVDNAKKKAENKEDEMWFPRFDRPELLKDSENYLENMEKFLKEFELSWKKVDGAAGYELRAYPEAITKENWSLAAKVLILSQEEDDNTVKAIARLTPTPKIYKSNCVNCGECYRDCPTGAISMQNNKATVDYTKCIECGECFRACDYDAIGGVFAGTEYYFAIRAYDADTAFSKEVACTKSQYKVRYTSLASLHDSLIRMEPKVMGMSGVLVKGATGCAGNCTDGSSDANPNGECGQCYILQENACPVDAIYEVDSTDIEKMNSTKGAIFIDHNKCINCGECALACYGVGPKGAIMTEVIKVD